MPEFQGVKQSNKVILMKVSSRERPELLLETVRQYVSMANNTEDMAWLFSFDYDDSGYQTTWFAAHLNALLEQCHRHVVYAVSQSKIHAINRDIGAFTFQLTESPIKNWDILLNISDDQRPIVKGYDDTIRRIMPDDLDASLWFFDGQPRVNTQEIIGRVYYDRFGYIYNPEYKSLFCDNEATDVAALLGKQIKSKQQIVKHFHPAWGGSEAFQEDDLYRRNNKYWNEDQATYERRKANGFGL
jgi:hypothetical protein